MKQRLHSSLDSVETVNANYDVCRVCAAAAAACAGYKRIYCAYYSFCFIILHMYMLYSVVYIPFWALEASICPPCLVLSHIIF